jgi:hypothetical protein
LKPPSRENFAEQISLFEHALALDPQSVEGQSRLAERVSDPARALVLQGEQVTRIAVEPFGPQMRIGSVRIGIAAAPICGHDRGPRQ